MASHPESPSSNPDFIEPKDVREFRAGLREETGMGRGRLYGSLPPEIDPIPTPHDDTRCERPLPSEEEFFQRSQIARERRRAFREAGGIPRELLEELYLVEWGLHMEHVARERAAGHAWEPSRGELNHYVPDPHIPPIEEAPTRYLYLDSTEAWMANSSPDGETRLMRLPPSMRLDGWRNT